MTYVSCILCSIDLLMLLYCQVDQNIAAGVGNHGDMNESLLPGIVPTDPGCLDKTSEPSNPDLESPPPNADINLKELASLACLDDIKTPMEFIRALEGASLDGPHSHLDTNTIEHLRNPPTSPVDISDPDLHLGLDLFLMTLNCSQKAYTALCSAILCCHPNNEVLSYEQIKQRIAEISRVVPIVDHICVNTCLAFTGPFAELDSCPECGGSHYNSSGIARQEFHMMPLGPQLQALYCNSQSAQNMRY